MCELLGLAFNTPVSPGLSFRGFRHRGRRNRDGWGLAAITAKKPTIVKEPIKPEESDTAATLPDRDRFHATLFIGHVRAASRGRVSPANTHPFSGPFAGGTFTFAHNGLAFTRRESSFCHVSLRDEDWEADLDEEKEPDQRGYVLASRPLRFADG